eukprot:CAMPEP_0182443210 /NCGR_PEP_ID=MMETSP1172-20130603/1993_1 /TAXON_ID=708627 /ORGANISM="Timspurckia oligopyrenoides, Strain CCMP3278" /LENGTH=338 /DNA_ID=CAMNT_0024638399 /DNA_START=127 /DNA_END=1143 /DNA_ORIENTATION=+
MMPPLKLTLVGLSSVLDYSFATSLAKGNVFGSDQVLDVSIIDADSKTAGKFEKQLKGMAPIISNVTTFSSTDMSKALTGADLVVAGTPGGDLKSAADTFAGFGKAAEGKVDSCCRVFVVGPKAHTMSLVLSANMNSHERDFIVALSQAEQNAALNAFAKMTKASPEKIDRLALWGGGGDLCFADCSYLRVGEKWALGKLKSDSVASEFAASASQAMKGVYTDSATLSSASATAIQDYWVGQPKQWCSLGVASDESYGIDADIWYTVPVDCPGLMFKRVTGLPISPLAAEMMNKSIAALKKERDMVMSSVPKSFFVETEELRKAVNFSMLDVVNNSASM